MSPGSRAWWRGAAEGTALCTLVLFGWSAADQYVPEAPGAWLRFAASNLAVLVVAALAVGLVAWLLARWLPVPVAAAASGAFALAFVFTARAGASPIAWYIVALALIGLGALVGASVAASRGRGEQARPGRRHLVVGAVAGLTLAALLAWTLRPWASAPTPTPPVATAPGTPAAPDPSRPGPHHVATLTYGSGTDRHRPEFGTRADVRTTPVDASGHITGWSGGAAPDRTAFWGFDASALPINGRVWYPDDARGPLPLVLVVHGNTSAVTFSDDGYAYLGEHLASRGYVVASIDENFLNTSLLDGAGIGGLDEARARLVLAHLREWKRNTTNPLRTRLDLDRVALVGHSRGGAAVTRAAALQQDSAADDVPRVRAVVGIAPAAAVGPDGATPHLAGVDHLVLQGSHDVDVVSYDGLGQLDHVDVGDTGMRAGLYIERADHAQFTTGWGDRDIGFGLPARFIDTAALMTGDEQRRVAAGYTAAFLDLRLRGRREFARLLRDPNAGRAWLPGVRYLSTVAEGGSTPLITPSRTGEAAWGVGITASGFTTREVIRRPMRTGPDDGHVVRLAWNGGARYDIAVPASASRPGSLRLDAAAPAAVPLTVEVTDRDGTRATTQVTVPDPVVGRSLLADWMHPFPLTEPVPQTLTVSLADLAAGTPGFDASAPARISLLTPADRAGEVLLGPVVLHP